MGTVARHGVWRLLAIFALLAATIGDGSARAAPAEQATTVSYLSDLSPSIGGPFTPRLDLSANGGPLKLRTATTPQTYPKGIGMKVAGGQPWLYAGRPAGCTGFAAMIGHDSTALNTDGELAGFELYEYTATNAQTQTNFGDMGRTAVQQSVTKTLAASTTYISLSVRGNGLVDWGDAKFTGCPAPPTPTPTATNTQTPTATSTATALPTSTTVPPTSTATPMPSGTVNLSAGQSVTVTCPTAMTESGPQTARVLTCPGAPSGFTHGIFEEGNLDVYNDPEAVRAMMQDIKARGFSALIWTNGNLGRNNGFLTVADQVGGIKVYVGAPEMMPPAHEVYTSADATQIATTVSNQFKNHPSFAGYYLQDEPADDYADDLALLAQAFKGADPAHDVFITNNAIDSRISTFSPQYMRPLVIDPYPFVLGQAACDLTTPTGPAAGYAYAPFIDELISRSGKPASMPFFMIGQAFSGAEWRAPSAEEVRAQYRVAREKGAAAMFWFIWSSVPSEGLVGLKDNPSLMAAVQALAQGQTGGSACDGLSTSTPTPTVATSTATATPASSQGGAGVPSVPLNYSETVDQFWARHPANSSATGYVASLPTQGPVINIAPGQNLQQILDTQCPTAGCTLRLLNGNHGRLRIIGRSNVHIRGESRTGTHFQGVQIASCDGAIMPGGSYTIINEAENAGEQWALDCLRNRQRNFSVSNLTFDGQGVQLAWEPLDHLVINSGLVARAVLDVWVEDVDVTGYVGSDDKTPHDGILMGNYYVDNFLVRRANFLQEGKSFIFADGCRACAVLDSTFPFAGSGAVAFYTNDDATDDLNGNGLYDEGELRLARYIVLRGNTVAANNAFAFAVQGQYALIENNTTTGFHREFALLQTRRPFNHPAGTYVYKSFGHVVRNNTIQSAFAYVVFNMPDQCDDVPSLTPDQCLQAGQITVTGNHMLDKGRLLSDVLLWTSGASEPEFSGPWPAGWPKHPPITVSGNN